MNSKAYWEVIENSIRKIARQFVENEGEGAFNLYNEREVEASLFIELRRSSLMKAKTKDDVERHLVHLQQPCVENRWLDIVVWDPRDIDSYRKDWGSSLPHTAPNRRLLAAIQIKHGHGEITPLKGMMEDLEDLEPIDSSRESEDTMLYFIEFADCYRGGGLSNKRYDEIQKILQLWCNNNPERRRALVLSKDKIGFAYPTKSWIINPRPPGTIEKLT